MGVRKVAWSVCLPRRPQDAAALIPAAVPAQVLLPQLASCNAAAEAVFALDCIACCQGRAHAAYTRLLVAAVLCVVKQLAALRHAIIALDAYRTGGSPESRVAGGQGRSRRRRATWRRARPSCACSRPRCASWRLAAAAAAAAARRPRPRWRPPRPCCTRLPPRPPGAATPMSPLRCARRARLFLTVVRFAHM